MSIAGAVLIALFLALGGVHLYWGLGGLWPGHDPDSLRLMVVGTPRGPMPPAVGPIPGLWVAAIIAGLFWIAAGFVALAHTRWARGWFGWIVRAALFALMLIFLVRGLAPYLTGAFDYARETPFYALNRFFYAPLCLFVAALLLVDFPRGRRGG